MEQTRTLPSILVRKSHGRKPLGKGEGIEELY
jgi:hypothetical protein